MSVHFSCACGKRLRASDQLGGKAVRCPQCGNRVTVPLAHPSKVSNEPEPLFEITEENEPAAPDGGLSFPWLQTADEPLLDSKASSAVVSKPAPRVEPDTPIAALITITEPEPAATRTEPPPELEELIQPADEPIRPSYVRPSAGRDPALSAPGLREPWYVAWVEGFARMLTVLAIACLVLAPAAVLIGGLIALARTGDPKAIFAPRWMGVSIFAAVLTSAGIIVATAAMWAAPFLLIVDLWRRYRAMSARLDAFLNRAERPSEAPDQ
jgi:DNA-directed RNA polymerase subunit RPC12/RpoP